MLAPGQSQRDSMLRHLLPVLPLLCSLSSLQGPLAVGTRDVSWSNSTGQGSSTLAARVLYPAATATTNAPILPQPGGWPTIVFLHGFAVLGNSYATLGANWAQQGFLVVLSNTMQFDNQGQEYDGRALFAALQAANTAPGGPFLVAGGRRPRARCARSWTASRCTPTPGWRRATASALRRCAATPRARR